MIKGKIKATVHLEPGWRRVTAHAGTLRTFAFHLAPNKEPMDIVVALDHPGLQGSFWLVFYSSAEVLVLIPSCLVSLCFNFN